MEAREYLEQVNKLKKKIESLKKLSDYYDRMSYSEYSNAWEQAI